MTTIERRNQECYAPTDEYEQSFIKWCHDNQIKATQVPIEINKILERIEDHSVFISAWGQDETVRIAIPYGTLTFNAMYNIIEDDDIYLFLEKIVSRKMEKNFEKLKETIMRFKKLKKKLKNDVRINEAAFEKFKLLLDKYYFETTLDKLLNDCKPINIDIELSYDANKIFYKKIYLNSTLGEKLKFKIHISIDPKELITRNPFIYCTIDEFKEKNIEAELKNKIEYKIRRIIIKFMEENNISFHYVKIPKYIHKRIVSEIMSQNPELKKQGETKDDIDQMVRVFNNTKYLNDFERTIYYFVDAPYKDRDTVIDGRIIPDLSTYLKQKLEKAIQEVAKAMEEANNITIEHYRNLLPTIKELDDILLDYSYNKEIELVRWNSYIEDALATFSNLLSVKQCTKAFGFDLDILCSNQKEEEYLKSAMESEMKEDVIYDKKYYRTHTYWHTYNPDF